MSRFIIWFTIAFVSVWAAPFHNKQQINDISTSVVKIYTTSVAQNYHKPWQKGISSSSSGTGVVIEGNLILTAAHVVNNGTFIQVKRSNEAQKYTAKVKWIAHEADLALLEVDDARFFKGVIEQKFGGLPYRQDGVVVYGYPVGGDELSTTKGIVSRIEHMEYAHSFMDHLIIQIDAPINPGNSGGPAFDQEGHIVGIAIQALTGSNGIGYLVPVEVIKHFLSDIEDGKYDGFPADGIYIQSLENKNIRDFYKLGERTGVLVEHLAKNASAKGYVQKEDVILAVDDVPIAGDNTMKLKNNGRISSNYLIRRHQVGDMLKVKILRDNKEMMVSFPLKKSSPIVPYEHDKSARYYLFGGIVFVPLTVNYLQGWGRNWYSKAPIGLLYPILNQKDLDQNLDELVVLSSILPNEENADYAEAGNIVSKVNGTKVLSLKHLADLIEKSKEQYVKIELENSKSIILDKAKALEADKKTMQQYGIGKKMCL